MPASRQMTTLKARRSWWWKWWGVRAYDLHQKKGAYRRNGIREYLAWITAEKRVVWWELREDEYQEIKVGPDQVLQSGVFPGLWLDLEALLRGDMKAVLATLRHGLDSAEHKAFAAIPT